MKHLVADGSLLAARMAHAAAQWLGVLRRFPWRAAALSVHERFRADRLGMTAGSLTFTSTMALVPLVTVLLAGFTAFPMFGKLQGQLQQWLVESVVPDAIARQVLGYLTQFAGHASRLGLAGIAALFATALALILTIDRTLNAIWGVRRQRPWAQRLLVYWAALTLGPLFLALSLSLTSYALSVSRGIIDALPGGLPWLIDLVQFVLMACAVACIYRYVPNTPVRWAHAWTGGWLVSCGLELAKKLLALYLSKVPTYSVLYGAFATVPILLLWTYLAWLIVLAGAVLVAQLPDLLGVTLRRSDAPGWRFTLALQALQTLQEARATGQRGLGAAALAQALCVPLRTLQPVLESLLALDWVGRLQEDSGAGERYVLLVQPQDTSLTPLVDALLLGRSPCTEKIWEISRWRTLNLREVL